MIEQLGADGKRHPIRFESTVWSAEQQKWHSTKLEARAVLWALKKLRHYLYGVHFTIETDAQVLIHQLNRVGTEVPGSLMNRWMAAILLWDFEIKHVKGKKHVVADALSRYPQPDGWQPPEDPEDDLDAYIDYAMCESIECNLSTHGTPADDRLLGAGYEDESEEIAQYLVYQRVPPGMPARKRRAWRRQALTFYFSDSMLFKKASRNVAVRRVVDDKTTQGAIITEVHAQLGHRGVNGTATAIAQRYWWKDLWDTVKKYVATCVECQIHSSKRMQHMLTTTYSQTLWEKVSMDVVYMPRSRGCSFLVVAREWVTGWPEARGTARAESRGRPCGWQGSARSRRREPARRR